MHQSYLGISCICHNWKPGSLPQNTGDNSEQKTSHQEQKHGVVEDDEKLKPPTPSRCKSSLHQGRQNKKNIQNHCLHGIEPYIPADARVPNNQQVEREEGNEIRIGEAFVGGQDGVQRSQQTLCHGILQEEIAPVLNTIEKRKYIAQCSENPFWRLDAIFPRLRDDTPGTRSARH